MQSLAEWIEAVETLRRRLLEEPSTDTVAADRIQLRLSGYVRRRTGCGPSSGYPR